MSQEIAFGSACVARVYGGVRVKLRERGDSAVARVGPTNLWGPSVRPSVRLGGLMVRWARTPCSLKAEYLSVML